MALLRCAGISDLRLCCLADSRSWPSGSHPARAGREVESDRGCGRWYRSSWVGPSINVALIAVVRLERTDIIFCGLAASTGFARDNVDQGAVHVRRHVGSIAAHINMSALLQDRTSTRLNHSH